MTDKIKHADGVAYGKDSIAYHCECGGYLCIRPIGMLERYPGPMSCPECGALMDWRNALQEARVKDV